MSEFPRAMIGKVSVSRMIIGTNWFLGYTHSTVGQSKFITRTVTNRKNIADIIVTFMERGVDTIMCPHTKTCMFDAIDEAQQRSGKKLVIISTQGFPTPPETPKVGFNESECNRVLDGEVAKGVAICMPHVSTTDLMVDKCTREIRHMDTLCRLIRERGMEPGLSTHIPETVIYADETGLDVEAYIQLYNSMGFLMQLEVDWIARMIQNAKKPVVTIKPMAAGQIRPLQALTFVWNTIRDCDMVTVGTVAPEEAEELVQLSLDILGRRASSMELQKTRSKSTILPKEVAA